jgi:uncharacterized protein YukE
VRPETAGLNYRTAIRNIQEIQDAAAAVCRLAYELEEALAEMRTGWTGQAAELFQGEGKKLQENLLRHAGLLRRAASGMSAAAWELYQTEQRLLEQENDAQGRNTGREI